MSDITKAIRFSKSEWDIIARFLKQNPFFDFSSMARTAIHEFVHNPRLELKAVLEKKPRESVRGNTNEAEGSNGRI